MLLEWTQARKKKTSLQLYRQSQFNHQISFSTNFKLKFSETFN
jgi:dipeptide/tripeptide permease